MEKNLSIFKNNVKLAFSKVKEHISNLKKEIGDLKSEIANLRQEIKNFQSSTGNQGVELRRRQTVDKESTNLRQTSPTSIKIEDIEAIKEDVELNFRTLTDKQFSIFLTIYQIEEELNRPVSYIEIAEKSRLSQSVIRDYASELILKKVPLIKLKQNNKVYLSIPKEFRSLNLASKLIKFRRFDANQTTLFDSF